MQNNIDLKSSIKLVKSKIIENDDSDASKVVKSRFERNGCNLDEFLGQF